MVGAGLKFKTSAKGRTARLATIAVFVALIAVGAFIKLPIGIVSVSLQCAMCVWCMLLLGPWDSLVAVAIYICMGLVGIPIFTAGGGFAYVFQPTFGYIIGYLLALPLGGIIARGVKSNAPIKFARLLAGALVAVAVVYTFGVTYMYLMLNFYVGTDMPLDKAWLTGAAVFLPTDVAWCVVGAFIARKVAPLVDRERLARGSVAASLMREVYVRETSPTARHQ